RGGAPLGANRGLGRDGLADERTAVLTADALRLDQRSPEPGERVEDPAADRPEAGLDELAPAAGRTHVVATGARGAVEHGPQAVGRPPGRPRRPPARRGSAAAGRATTREGGPQKHRPRAASVQGGRGSARGATTRAADLGIRPPLPHGPAPGPSGAATIVHVLRGE